MEKYNVKYPQQFQQNKDKKDKVEDIKTESEKQKYRERVQSYTSYQIGQKLNDNKLYSQY